MTTRAAQRRLRRRRAAAALLLVLVAAVTGAGLAVRHAVLARTQDASASPTGSGAPGTSTPVTSASTAPASRSTTARIPTATGTTTKGASSGGASSNGLDPAAHSTTDPASPWVVVNKAHPISRRYVPASLTVVGGKQVSTAVLADLQAMLAAASGDGVHLTLASGYRSYAYQIGVHDRLVRQQGLAAAESVSARPGYSEHQTGLAIDFGSTTDPGCTLKDCYATTVEGRWLDAHAAQYGFLHRYTAADATITGYDPEAWHYRWVGRDLTAAMAARGIPTLEQFFGVSGGTVYASPLP